MSDKRPIAVFDSGVGGISVLRNLYKMMPYENYIYFGDSSNAPYGSKSASKIRKLTLDASQKLFSMGAKALVVACNTATSVAIDLLREKYEYPVIGVEPALKPAVLNNEGKTIVVMATPLTLHEEKFKHLMEHYSPKAKIIPLECHLMAEYVEKGIIEGKILEDYILSLFDKLGKIDAVVLGCTHYPFVKKTIQKVLGSKVSFYDGGEGTARETLRRLKENGLLNEENNKGEVKFLTSLESEEEIEFCEKLFNLE